MLKNEKTEAKKREKRMSLSLNSAEAEKIAHEFKYICKKEKKRYTKVLLELMKDYVENYKATR